MSDTKFTELTEQTSFADTDIIPSVDVSEGTSGSRKFTFASLRTWVLAQLGDTATKNIGTSAGTVAAGDDSRFTDARTPTAHASTHANGQSDALKLDDLATPDDNTDLDVSTTRHGLVPKAPNDTQKFLRGDGTWAVPTVAEPFKVGGIYTNITGNDPSTELGYGTWSQFSSGRFLVGYASGDADFGTVEGTGGAKRVALLASELPSHTHTVTDEGHTHTISGGDHTHTYPDHSHAITDPGHNHTVTDPGHAHDAAATGGSGTDGLDTIGAQVGTTSNEVTGVTVDSGSTGITATDEDGGGNTGSATPTMTAAASGTGITIDAQGDGADHENLPPYTVVYFWVRTA